MSRALTRLREEYERLGKERICDALIPLLKNGTERGDHQIIGATLGITENHSKVALSRFKRDFVNQLRREVGETVADADELAAELRHLLGAWFSEPT